MALVRLASLVSLALLVLSAACGSSGGVDATPEPASTDLHLTAKRLRFDKKTLVAVGNSEISLTLGNQDGVPHNLSVYPDKRAKNAIFKGDIISGRETRTFHFRTGAPGTYYFRCDLHPDMNGTFIVQ